MTDFTPAKRGDLAVIGMHYCDYVIGQGAREYSTFEVCQVIGISREGVVRKVRDSWGSEYALRPDRRRMVTVVPARIIDAPAAYEATCARTYPGTEQPKPFDSLDEVREALRPFLLAKL